MKHILFLSITMMLNCSLWAQHLTQTVKGTITDTDSRSPLIGVQVVIVGSNPLKGTITDINGQFRLSDVNVGNVTLQCSYIGYETITLPEINVISGKETSLNIHMQESLTQMEAVIVTAVNDGAPINDMAIISTRSISASETNRYAGGFNDPARILSNFAGVNNSQDGSADIIVRGNSPKYLQWRLEGVQIGNPNHFADISAIGSNSFNAINNNILATSDFYTGAFPAEFGDALSGIYDLRMRTGNNDKFEGIAGVGLIGTDLTLEGPFKKGYDGSFLVNYRFTTIAIADKLGLLSDLGGVPNFQDAAFKLSLPSKKIGTFSLFGLIGKSNIKFEDVDPGTWQTASERGSRSDISENFNKDAYLFNMGLNHIFQLNKNSFLQSTLAYSSDGVEDAVTEHWSQESGVTTRDNFNSHADKSVYRLNMTYNNKLNARNTLQVGSKFAQQTQKSKITEMINDAGETETLTDFNESIGTLRNFASLKHRFSDRFSMVAGIHNMNVLYNNKSTIEPRLAAQWQVTPKSSINFGYGMHSTMERIHHYFVTESDENGNISFPNKDLDLLKAHHWVVGFDQSLGQNMHFKTEVYYQHLYDLPVANDVKNSYSTVNETVDIQLIDLVNEGTGKNYGVELTLEKFYSNHSYFTINSSVYQSKYTALDGVERNTAFNNNYMVNILVGKDFTGWGKKNNQTFSINAKGFLGGGRKIMPLLRDENGNVAVDTENGIYYDESKAYENDLGDIQNITLSMSYKWQKTKTTHELYLNIDNITNNKPKLTEYYNESEPGNVGYLTPIGTFPNLMYRVYF